MLVQVYLNLIADFEINKQSNNDKRKINIIYLNTYNNMSMFLR